MSFNAKFDEVLNFFKKNHKWILIIIMLLAFILRVYYFSQTYNQAIWWDEADYMSHAKRVGKSLDIRDIWYYRRTVLLPTIWAGMFRLGFDEPAIRFTQIFFSLGLMFFGYLLAKEMFNKWTGLIVATGLGFSRLSLFIGTRFMNSMSAACFASAGFWLFWKGYVKKQGNKYIWLSGLCIALAMSIRFALLLSLIPLGSYIFFNEKGKFWKNKHVWIAILVLVLVLTPYFINYATHYEGGILNFISHYTGIGRENVEESDFMGLPGIWGHIKSLSNNIGIIFSIFAIIGLSLFLNLVAIDKIFSEKRVRKAFFFLMWILPPLIFHGMYSDYVQERYMLWVYPAILMFVGSGMTKSYYYLKKKYKSVTKVFLVVLVFLILINVYGQIKMGDELIENKKHSYREVKLAGLWMKENSKPGDVIISNSIPQIQYYSERSTYMGHNASHIESLNPKFVMLSVFEGKKEWFFNYPVQKKLPVVQAYFADEQGQQPLVIIYQYRN